MRIRLFYYINKKILPTERSGFVHLPMSQFFKLGIVHYTAYPDAAASADAMLASLEAVAADADFQAIECAAFGTTGMHGQARSLFSAAGLTVSYSAAPAMLKSGLSANDTDETVRRRAVQALREGIDEAAAMGATSFTFQSGQYIRGREMDALSQLLTTTHALIEHAKQYNITVNCEVCDFDADLCALIGPANLARSYAAQVKQTHPDFGLTLNLAHLPLNNETPREAIGPVKDLIVKARLGNTVLGRAFPSYGAKYVRFGYPGGANGKKELADFLRTLVFIRFIDPEKQEKPIISLMVGPVDGEDSRFIIAGAKRALADAWAIA